MGSKRGTLEELMAVVWPGYLGVSTNFEWHRECVHLALRFESGKLSESVIKLAKQSWPVDALTGEMSSLVTVKFEEVRSPERDEILKHTDH